MTAIYLCGRCGVATDGDDSAPTKCCRALHVRAPAPIYIPPCTCGARRLHAPRCPHFDPMWDAAPLGARAIERRLDERWERYSEIDRRHRIACRPAHLPDPTPWTARPFGCECGAGLHEGETHEEALLAEAVEASTSCTCGGYVVDGELLHDGLCDAGDEPGPVYQLTEIGHGRIVLGELGLMPRGAS